MNNNHNISDFLFYCKYEKNLSLKTIKAYSIDLKQFIFYLTQKNIHKNIAGIDKHIIRSFIKNLFQKYKEKTIKRKIATLKTFFNYLEFEDIIRINPFQKLRIKVKEPRRLPKIINMSEIKILFKTIYKKKKTFSALNCYSYNAVVRDIAIIELLFATGARVSEICSLKNNNINLKKGYIQIIGKGNKERIINICNIEVINILKEYYLLFKSKIHNTNYFFINKFNKKISEQSIRFMVKKYCVQAGISKHITPHMFRHSLATLLLENGVDIRYIQQLLGHASILTTQIYTQVNNKQQRKIMRINHPRREFTMVYE